MRTHREKVVTPYKVLASAKGGSAKLKERGSASVDKAAEQAAARIVRAMKLAREKP
jgi:hypothetical protein